MGANSAGPIRLRLPATSANLGSGFDAVAVALDFHLEVEAHPAKEFSITATGRDAERCSQLEDNLILGIYQRLLEENKRAVVPLAMRMKNEIPLGMGCGSSAAGRLAAIALAVHFGELGWSDEGILEEASALEGHPDNAAACWLGGFVSAAARGRKVYAARVDASAGVESDRGDASRAAGDKQGPRGASGELLAPGCDCQSSIGEPAGTGFRAGTRRSSRCRHERSRAPALSRRDLPNAAAVAAFGRTEWDSRRGAERSRPGNVTCG